MGCGFLCNDGQMFISGKGGCLGIRTKMSAFISLRSCYGFTLVLNPWVQEIIKSQSPSAGTSGIQHYVRLGCPHLQAGHPSPQHTHTLLSSRLRKPRREPALLWRVSVAPSCSSQGSSQAPRRKAASGASSGSVAPQERETQRAHPVPVLPPL